MAARVRAVTGGGSGGGGGPWVRRAGRV